MAANDGSYRDRVAIITGGGAGIGAALSEELARRGARVVLADRDAAAVEAIAERIRSTQGVATAAVVDVTDAAAVEALVRTTIAEYGRIDILFNNAGIGCFGDVREFSIEQWRTIVDVNFWGCVHGSLAAYRWMAEHGGGQIVNTASLAGLVPVPGTVPYAAVKHAVVGFSLSLRAEAADQRVRVSVVCPGPVRSNFHDSMILPAAKPAPRQAPSDAEDTLAAACEILLGAEQNQPVIVFPARARRTWWKWRWFPSLLSSAHRNIVDSLRR
ncbi:MAG: SDR family oxidoreductase [Planctomycetia bacterium]|nr:SDR family oxidoreductase [Planctomycetia bacterium]